MGFPIPFPPGVRVLNVSSATVTVLMTLPRPVAEQWAEMLEVASWLTGSEKLGANVQAMCQELTSSWGVAHAPATIAGIPERLRKGRRG